MTGRSGTSGDSVIPIPDKLVALVKRFEGFSPRPYRCPAGYWTIGYGELCTPDTPPITEPEAARRLVDVLLPVYVGHALRLSPRLRAEHPDRLAAIADFVYNLGPTAYAASTLRRRVDAGDWPGAAIQIRRWVYGGGRVLPGLVLRREAEAVLLGPRDGAPNGV